MELAAALRIDDAWWPRPQRGVHRHTVGARPVEAASWLAPRPHDEQLVRVATTVLDLEGGQAFAAQPGTEVAGAAVLALLGAEPDDRHPLDTAGRRVAEDLCLVDVTGPEPVLTAGSVAFPSGWRIDHKVGRSMLGVHEQVPGYAAQIGTASDRLIQKLTGDRIVGRVNWTLQAGAALFRPPGTLLPSIETPDDAGRLAHLRVEYQTLRAVTPGAVLFTIRTALEPLEALTDRPGRLAGFADALRRLPPEHREYKGMSAIVGPVLSWLEEVHLR